MTKQKKPYLNPLRKKINEAAVEREMLKRQQFLPVSFCVEPGRTALKYQVIKDMMT